MALPTAVVAGIAAGAATSLVVAVLVAAWLVVRRLKARRDRSSETGSSEAPPTLAEWGRFGRTASAPEFHGARQHGQRIADKAGVQAKALNCNRSSQSLAPPLIHRDFKTSNVLVDENFIAKVSDAGIDRLLRGFEDAGPSQQSNGSSAYQDPEQELLLSMEAHFASNELVDPRLGGSYTSEGMTELVGLAFQCLSPSARRRPKMRLVAAELDRILEKEMTLTTVMGDGTAIVTLGSQLFTS
ncbi:hypothetical protein EJB05_16533, partial [Eragrostis curvula]